MAKGKLQKFAEMETFPNVFQCVYDKNRTEEEWQKIREDLHKSLPTIFKSPSPYGEGRGGVAPLILELGCGKGEYTVELGRLFPDINFIGVDIKGARMHTGAKEALDSGMKNVAFLRTNIEIIDRFFYENEVSEIWLTFSDPQMKNVHKRLTSTFFMERYRRFLIDNGIIHLKTDSNFLFTYTKYMVEHNSLPMLFCTEDLYHGAGSREQGAVEERPVLGDSVAEKTMDEETKHILGIKTHYEKQWIARGLNIRYMKFRLPHAVKLEESGKEIELDEYRSYHRDKRSGLDKNV